MASLLGAVRRNWYLQRPPVAPKAENALKFGILGAANIAPMALITPAISHPEVVIQAVAARDKAKATAFAKKHGIPTVMDNYQAILDDPSIDAVYIPLPNGLHFEWALKALAKGKHVLLEKPSTSNAAEAETLFRSPLLKQPGAPVLMEAFHNRFTPAWRLFTDQLDPPHVVRAKAVAQAPRLGFSQDDIRFNYDLAGGALMDIGTYAVAALRGVFGAEPEACVECEVKPMPAPRERCDGNFRAKFRFPRGAVGEIEGGLQGSLLALAVSVEVVHSPVEVRDGTGTVAVEEGTTVTRARTVRFVNFMISNLYHRIDVTDDYVVRRKGSADEVVKKFTRKETKKAYTFREMGLDQPGEEYWQTYRYMLEQFVNRIRGREGTGAWVDHEGSIAQMKALDMVYEKSGLGVRPSRGYKPQNG